MQLLRCKALSWLLKLNFVIFHCSSDLRFCHFPIEWKVNIQLEAILMIVSQKGEWYLSLRVSHVSLKSNFLHSNRVSVQCPGKSLLMSNVLLVRNITKVSIKACFRLLFIQHSIPKISIVYRWVDFRAFCMPVITMCNVFYMLSLYV